MGFVKHIRRKKPFSDFYKSIKKSLAQGALLLQF